jgi:hypothetical protein
MFDTPGMYNAVLTLDDGLASTVVPFEVMVEGTVNQPPTVLTADDLSGEEGESLSFSATFSDADVLDTHTATVDWGDGSSSPGSVPTPNGISPLASDSESRLGSGKSRCTISLSVNFRLPSGHNFDASIGRLSNDKRRSFFHSWRGSTERQSFVNSPSLLSSICSSYGFDKITLASATNSSCCRKLSYTEESSSSRISRSDGEGSPRSAAGEQVTFFIFSYPYLANL